MYLPTTPAICGSLESYDGKRFGDEEVTHRAKGYIFKGVYCSCFALDSYCRRGSGVVALCCCCCGHDFEKVRRFRTSVLEAREG